MEGSGNRNNHCDWMLWYGTLFHQYYIKIYNFILLIFNNKFPKLKLLLIQPLLLLNIKLSLISKA